MRPAARAAATLALLLGSTAARAHGASAALGGFGGGLVHPLLEPAQLVAVIVVALLLGQPGFRQSRDALLALALGLLLGLGLAALGRDGPTDVPLLVLAAAGGVLVAIGRAWPLPLLGALAAAAGAGIGLGSMPEGGTALQRGLALAGTFVGTCLWIADGALLIGLLQQRPWGRVLVRVLGSWMAAVALLVLALQFAPARGADSRRPQPEAMTPARAREWIHTRGHSVGRPWTPSTTTQAPPRRARRARCAPACWSAWRTPTAATSR